MTDLLSKSYYKKSKKRWPWSQLGCLTFAGEADATDILYVLGGGGEVGLGGWCERSCGGMRQRGYQFMEGFLCPISSVKGHVPRVLTLVTSLASSLPGDLGPGVFITNPLHRPTTISPLHPPNTALPMEENKTPPSLSSARVHVLIGCISIHWCRPICRFVPYVKYSEVNTGLSKSYCTAISYSMFFTHFLHVLLKIS